MVSLSKGSQKHFLVFFSSGFKVKKCFFLLLLSYIGWNTIKLTIPLLIANNFRWLVPISIFVFLFIWLMLIYSCIFRWICLFAGLKSLRSMPLFTPIKQTKNTCFDVERCQKKKWKNLKHKNISIKTNNVTKWKNNFRYFFFKRRAKDSKANKIALSPVTLYNIHFS